VELDRALQEITRDRTHGASYLASRALAFLREIEEREVRVAFAKRVAGARPSMAVVANEMGRFLRAQSESLADGVYLEQRLAERRDLPARVAVQAAPHLAGDVVAISYSETLVGALGAAPGGGTVWVMESRPLREGIALAGAIRAAGRAAVLITDAQAALFAARASCAVAGADAILGDGSVANKAGTHLLALAARAAGVPFYVLAESAKVTDLEMGDFELEEKDPSELGGPVGLPARNLYFEVTPARLIRTIFTEDGLLTRDELRRLVREARQFRRLLAE
jgi:translation initiation factor eIF-2B subunit delta